VADLHTHAHCRQVRDQRQVAIHFRRDGQHADRRDGIEVLY
jgi:hypothetical protein